VALGRAGGSISLDELWFDGATTGKCFAHQYGVITMRYSKSYVWIVAVMLQSDNEDELLQGEVLGVYASLPAAQDAARSLAHRGRVGVIEFEVRS
jgi:hypothetical protein